MLRSFFFFFRPFWGPICSVPPKHASSQCVLAAGPPVPCAEWLKRWTQVWRLQVQGQGGRRLRPRQERASRLVDGGLLSESARGGRSGTRVTGVSACKDASPPGSGPALWTLSNSIVPEGRTSKCSRAGGWGPGVCIRAGTDLRSRTRALTQGLRSPRLVHLTSRRTQSSQG